MSHLYKSFGNKRKGGVKTTYILLRIVAPDLSFTLSAGIAEYKDEYNEKMWLDVADKAMYYSKEHGRNQIHVAE